MEALGTEQLISDKVFRASGLSQFRGDVSEIAIAYSLYRSGARLQPLDIGKGGAPVADYVVERKGRSACIEILSPRTWEKLASLQRGIWHVVKNVDHPASFGAGIEINIGGSPLAPAPTLEAAAAALSRTDRSALTEELSTVLGRVLRGDSPPSILVRAKDSSIEVRCTLTAITSRSGLPNRCISVAEASLGGYAPEGLFMRILRGAVGKKLRSGQALRQAGLPGVLIVDVRHMQLDTEWGSPVYSRRFRELLQTHVTDLKGHAALAFVHADLSGTPLEILLAKEDVGFQLADLLT